MSEQANNQPEATSTGSVALPCVYGIKSGMTSVFDAEGKQIPVTVVSFEHSTVITQVKTKEKEGYDAVQLSVKSKRAQRANKAEKGHFAKAGHPGFYFTQEFRLPKADAALVLGASVDPSAVCVEGEFLDVCGTTIGKGFQGVVKRWNFGGQPATHGHSVSHRSPGSIGNRADPGRVHPGKKMATHYGDIRQTTQNLRVVAYDAEAKVVLIEGAVPGCKNGVVRLTKAVKKASKKKKA